MSDCSSFSKMWCGELCWILLEDMIVEPFGDILPLNTFVHFCQTFLEGILVRHSFERVVVWKTLFWNTHWKIHSSKTLSDTSGLVATCCDLLLQSVVENLAPIVSGTFQSSKVPGILVSGNRTISEVGSLRVFMALYGSFTGIFCTLAKYAAPKDEVPFLFVKVAKWHKTGLLGESNMN